MQISRARIGRTRLGQRIFDCVFSFTNASKRTCGKICGAIRPRTELFSRVRPYAVAVSQILLCRVSGINSRPSRKHTAGTAIG